LPHSPLKEAAESPNNPFGKRMLRSNVLVVIGNSSEKLNSEKQIEMVASSRQKIITVFQNSLATGFSENLLQNSPERLQKQIS
jgi:hypothetical protein